MSQMLVKIPTWNLFPKSGPAIPPTFLSARAAQWPHSQVKSHKREIPCDVPAHGMHFLWMRLFEVSAGALCGWRISIPVTVLKQPKHRTQGTNSCSESGKEQVRFRRTGIDKVSKLAGFQVASVTLHASHVQQQAAFAALLL